MPERVAAGEVIYPSVDLGATGTTPGIQIVNKVTGATLLARTTTGVTEQPSSGGSYDYTTGFTVPAVAAFKVAWNTSAGAVVATEDYIVTDTATSIASLFRQGVTITAPVDSSGDISIVQGRDYLNVDGRALIWSTTDSSTWPTLTSAAVVLTAQYKGQTITKSGSVDTATGANKAVHVDIAASDTSSKRPGRWTFDLHATLSNGHVVTLQRGTLNLIDDLA